MTASAALDRSHIIETIKAALPKIVSKYENYSGRTPSDMPESTIRDGIAERLHRDGGYWCVPELRIDRLVVDLGFSRGKLDIIVYDATTDPAGAQARFIIEVKGPKTTWLSFTSDCDRMRSLLNKSAGTIEFGLLVYVTPEMPPEQLSVSSATRRSLAVSPKPT